MSEQDRRAPAGRRLVEEGARDAARQRGRRLLVVVLGAVALGALVVALSVVVVSRNGGAEPLADNYTRHHTY